MYNIENGLYVAHCNNGAISIVGKMANRHGLIAGATGTGKTVSLQVLAETFSQAGVPCFMADMKGDLSGISQKGSLSGFIEKRMHEFGIENPTFDGCPTIFFDVFGEQGHPIRATISQMGPQLLSRLLNLNETQDGVLNIVFKIADDKGLQILDMKDLRAILDFVSKHSKEYTTLYGNISTATIGAIQRSLLQLENQGANNFFGEPSFNIHDFIQKDNGKGVMNVLAADKLIENPKLYSTFLLWLLSELYSSLPEVGDLDMPKFVFFFDEAHTLFEDTSKTLIDKIEKVIRLIRSKGVGIYFITQYPSDIPEKILGQLGNRIQHALRAYTPKDQKAVRAAADTFRANPEFKTDDAITNLETGEALVSFLDEKGAPNVVQKAKILFPLSKIGPIEPSERNAKIRQSSIYGKYDTMIDSISAFEILTKEYENGDVSSNDSGSLAKNEKSLERRTSEKKSKNTIFSKVLKAIFTAITATVATAVGTAVSDKVSGKKTKSSKSTKEKIVKNTTSAATRTITREITRDILGNIMK